MEDGKKRISFIKDAEITDEKADTIYLALSNEIANVVGGGVESLSGFGSDGASAIIGRITVASKLKRNNSKRIFIH